MEARFIFANSFDRSGSSMLAKVLARHPDIECLFQPLNSSIFRKEIFNYWRPGEEHQEGKQLIENIIKGKLGRDVIKSHWFYTHSTTFQIEENKYYLIKTTNGHFKIAWLRDRFPEFKFVCLFRAPLDILASLVRNGLHEEWYSREMAKECHRGFSQIDDMTARLGEGIDSYIGEDQVLNTACIIAMMNYVMKKDSLEREVIRFEEILQEPDRELNRITSELGLDHFPFSGYLKEDYNIIGRPFVRDRSWQHVLGDKNAGIAQKIFTEFGLTPPDDISG